MTLLDICCQYKLGLDDEAGRDREICVRVKRGCWSITSYPELWIKLQSMFWELVFPFKKTGGKLG